MKPRYLWAIWLLTLLVIAGLYSLGASNHAEADSVSTTTGVSVVASDRMQGLEPRPLTPLARLLAIESPEGETRRVDSIADTGYAASNWQIERVDAPKYFQEMTDRSLALDADGHPHIAYGADRLYYAWHDGTGWQVDTVDSTGGVGRHSSLALDSDNHPHVSYYDSTNNDLKYAHHDGTAWQIETVDGGGWVGLYTSLALDTDGRPHISYRKVGYPLRYAYYDGTSWHIETVNGAGDGWWTSLALDSAGHPHISYNETTNDDLRYAHHDGSTWQIETVDSTAYVGWYSSLALDSAGLPRISYWDTNSDGMKYAYHDGSAWQIEMVDSEGSAGLHTSLALDSADLPHISYWGGFSLRYAHHDGSTWQIETLNSGEWWENVGEYTSLALDADDRPHISYADETNGDLKYAHHDGSGWQIETVDTGGNVGCYTSVALDDGGRSHISYSGNYDLKYAHFDGSAWQIETVDTEGEVGTHTALALNPAGWPRISYLSKGGAPYGLKYAHYEGSSWQIDRVESGAGSYNSLALDTAGRPHISYCDDSNDDLKYAHHDGSAWQIETVDTEGDVGWFTSLALDGDDFPHISYYDDTNDDLKYAHQHGTAWQIETVDSEGDIGRHTSLALDAAGRPHISYRDSANHDVKYAYHDGTSWTSETVDSSEYRIGSTSLALDADDHPQIAYSYWTTPWHSALKYARYDGSVWQIEMVDSEGDVGQYASLALSASGGPHISYYDGTYYDLKYAYRPAGGGVDLSIDSVAPVQVFEGEDLVSNKATAVKVVVHKSGQREVYDIHVKATYNGTDYTTFYVSESGNLSDWVLQNDNAVYPLNFAAAETTKAIYFFADGLAPASPGTYQVNATVDYQNAVAEANEGNNTATSTQLQIHDTNWTGNLFPALYVKYFRSDWGSTSRSVFDDYYGGSREFIQGTYPVSGQDFQPATAQWWEGDSTFYRGLDGKLSTLEFALWALALSVDARLSAPTSDRFISVMPPGWFANYTTDLTDAAGVAFPSIRTLVFAEVLTNRQGTARYVPAAHELGHSYSLRLDCEEYYFQDANCPEKMQQHAPPDRIGETVTGGLWVEQRALMEHSAQHPVYCFMGAASDVTYWVDGEDYSSLRDDHAASVSAAAFGTASTNEAILVVGRAFITGTVELDDWYILAEAQVDDLPPGDYRLRYLDAGNLMLYEHAFDISFTVEGTTTTVAPFVFTAPHVPGTARIVVRHETTDLAEKTVTSNAPTVTVLLPNGGEMLRGKTTIDWSASDADGDPLSYAVLYSSDGGTTWNTLATDLDTTSYDWDLSGLPGGSNYLVKVIATDGFNTAQDTSDAPFEVTHNLLRNGSFEEDGRIPAPWRGKNLTLKDRRVCKMAHDGRCSFKMVGTTAKKSLRQAVKISGSAADTFTLQGWSKATKPLRKGGPYCLQARVFHTDGTKKNYRACFAKRTHTWQRRRKTFTTVKDYNKIVVYLLYFKQGGKAWFDDVRLILD